MMGRQFQLTAQSRVLLICYQPQLRKLEDLNERWEHLAKGRIYRCCTCRKHIDKNQIDKISKSSSARAKEGRDEHIKLAKKKSRVARLLLCNDQLNDIAFTQFRPLDLASYNNLSAWLQSASNATSTSSEVITPKLQVTFTA